MASKIECLSDLTDAERRALAHRARALAAEQLDARNYTTGAVESVEGIGLVHKLDERWATRNQRQHRWLDIAEALENCTTTTQEETQS